MPCQLAISITKAVVAHEALERLLTPTVLEAVVTPFLAQHYASFAPSVQRTPIGVTCRIGPVTCALTRGTLTVRTGARTPLAAQLVAQLERLLGDTGAAVYLGRVCDALRSFGPVSLQSLMVAEGATLLAATLLTLRYNGDVEVRVVVLPEGRLQLFVDGAIAFETARAVTLEMLAHLCAQGIPVQRVGAIEQHKDGVSHVHVVTHLEHAYDDS